MPFSFVRNLTKAEEKCKSLEKEIQENDEMLEKIDVCNTVFHLIRKSLSLNFICSSNTMFVTLLNAKYPLTYLQVILKNLILRLKIKEVILLWASVV